MKKAVIMMMVVKIMMVMDTVMKMMMIMVRPHVLKIVLEFLMLILNLIQQVFVIGLLQL